MVEIGQQKGMWYDETGLCAHNADTILGAIFNAIGKAYAITLRESKSPL
jgi:hypothetical protein